MGFRSFAAIGLISALHVCLLNRPKKGLTVKESNTKVGSCASVELRSLLNVSS